jgi:hypothetical protein
VLILRDLLGFVLQVCFGYSNFIDKAFLGDLAASPQEYILLKEQF